MIIEVRVSVNSKNPGVTKLTDNIYKVNVKSQREKGKANLELITLLADYFSINRDGVKILSGSTSKRKAVNITI